jgi:cation transport ATPase
MHPARPSLPARRCPACGAAVDPLRAGVVIAMDDGVRFLCGEPCGARFRDGDRPHDRFRAPTSTVRSLSERVRDATLAQAPAQSSPREARLRSGRSSLYTPGDPVQPAQGLAFAGMGLLLSFGASFAVLAVLSVLCTLVASGIALRDALPARRDVGALGWALGPAGAALAAVAALVSQFEESGSGWPLSGAALAAGAMVIRAWLDDRSRAPLARTLAKLRAPLPTTARVPLSNEATLDMSFRLVHISEVHAGDRVLAVDGEVVPVDGVVEAGTASVLLHPGATTPVERGPGEAVLAGARLTRGALRLLATRVADDRGLVRAPSFGANAGAGSSRIARLAAQFSRWGGIVTVGAAVAGLLMSQGGGLAGRLAAAAAALLAVPLLAVRRGSDSPLVAAGLAGAPRGIVFLNGRAVENAGNVAVAAFMSRGTVTTGHPEVLEVATIGDADAEELLGLTMAAQHAAPSHPIALALQRYGASKGIAHGNVRRATHHAGRGVSALAPGSKALVVGTRQLLLDEGVSVAVADAVAGRAEERGHTVVFVALDGRVRLVVTLQDPVRIGARAAAQRVFDLPAEVVLMSGDHRSTVEALGQQMDVTHVKAELLPEERALEVRRLGESSGHVAVVGRVQDVEALGAADVPIVLGAAGGIEGEAAVALANEDIRDAAAALFIARAARTEALRSVIASVVCGAVVVTGSMLGFIPPVVAALLALGVDAFALPSGVRLLRRVDLRVPVRG